jgi:acyl-CoA dehydrogenase
MTITTDIQSRPRVTDWTELARTVGTELAAGVAERDRSGAVARDGFARLRETGATAALVPVELGGGGATYAEAGAMLRELARHDSATAVTLAMHTHVVAQQVWRHRHGLDARAPLGKVAAGAILVTSGASDWVGSSGRAHAVAGGFRVSARKSPVSGCEVGDILVTSIRWDEAPDGPQVLHCSVPCTADGVRIDPTWDTLGLRATGSHTVVLDDVFVPDAAVALTRPADVWHPVWNMVLGAAMPLIMATYLGIGDAAVALARDAARGDGAPTLQLLGEMSNSFLTACDAVDAMFVESDDLRFDNTDEHASRVLSRKTVVTDALVATIDRALEIAGGRGYSRTCALERLHRDVIGCHHHPLPRARQLEFSGRVAVGLAPVAGPGQR